MGNRLQKPQEAEQPNENEPQQEQVPDFTCEICIEPTQGNRKFKNSDLCSHYFCLDCISKYIKVKVEGKSGIIECPGLSCKLPLDPLSCRPIVPKPLFDEWCDHLCESAVLGLDSCYCPYRDCSALVLNECHKKLKKIECPNCKKSFCFQCKIPWHAGYKCNESGQLRDSNDFLIGKLIEQSKWTRCYNCGQSVERVSGCRIIKCTCGVCFCHQCGERTHLGPCKNRCCACGDSVRILLCCALLLVSCFSIFIVWWLHF